MLQSPPWDLHIQSWFRAVMALRNPAVRKLVQSRILLIYLTMEFLFKFYLLSMFHILVSTETLGMLSRADQATHPATLGVL